MFMMLQAQHHPCLEERPGFEQDLPGLGVSQGVPGKGGQHLWLRGRRRRGT